MTDFLQALLEIEEQENPWTEDSAQQMFASAQKQTQSALDDMVKKSAAQSEIDWKIPQDDATESRKQAFVKEGNRAEDTETSWYGATHLIEQENVRHDWRNGSAFMREMERYDGINQFLNGAATAAQQARGESLQQITPMQTLHAEMTQVFDTQLERDARRYDAGFSLY